MKNNFIDQNYNTTDLFKKLQILTFKELYNKASITKMFVNKKYFKTYNIYNTRSEDKFNSTLMQNYYITRGIRLFNQLPVCIKLIENIYNFKLMLRPLYMRSFN